MRDEIKYWIAESDLPMLRRAIAPFTFQDPHCAGYEGRGYTVRSLYFDTPRLTYYQEKLAGIKDRKKLRIRGYNKPDERSWVFLEIKRKLNQRVAKNRAPVRWVDLPNLLETGNIDRWVQENVHYAEAKDDARRFLFHLTRSGLVPTFLTIYEREAFIGRFDPTLRITFDRNLRGRICDHPSRLFADENDYDVRSGFVILEVKYDTRLSRWLQRILSGMNLRQEAISKYCKCVACTGPRDNKFSFLAGKPYNQQARNLRSKTV